MKLPDYALVFATVVFAGISLFLFAHQAAGVAGLKLIMLDVGQGDAFLIETPRGNRLLIDAGPVGAVFEPLGAALSFTERAIDVLLLTHPDADHAGGAPELLERYDIGMIAIAPAGCEKELCVLIEERAREGGVPLYELRRGMTIELGDGAAFDVLYPVIFAPEAGNETSLVGLLRYGSSTALFTGDAPIVIERYLAATWGERLDIDVLKVGHHGSKTSTSDELLAVTTPAIALISAGRDNRYGHPHADVRARLVATGAMIYGSYESGTVALVSDGSTWRKVEP